MRDIINHHQSMYSLLEDYAIVYKKLLMFEQTISSPLVCLSAYCIADRLDNGEFQGILLLLCLTTIVVYLIPSLLCTYLAIKVNSVCDACWGTPFWNAGPVIRPYMVLIMQRSLRPLPLQAPGFKNISIETFSEKMTSAYSLFNMLRA
uniref:Olfactory receptor 42 n=1 Tax=Mythimna separata TaxID=271217 RepID=A0A1V1WBU0_MYTSE